MAVKEMTSKELHARIDAGDSVFILDVRNPNDFEDWKIEGKTLRQVNIPYFDFLEEDEAVYNQLPKETEIVVVCAKGGSAQMVAEQLDEKGYSTSVLEGGMLSWSQFYHPVTVSTGEDMKLIQLNRLAKGCLSYMVISGGEALVVDANRHIEEYMALAKRENVKIAHIIDTHLHADHISGGAALAQETGATYYLSSSEMQGSTALPYEPLEQHETLKIGSVNAKVLAVPTPGHTPGSTSVLIDDRFLLSGDTIFVGGLGRPDLGGKAREWAQSLYDTVFKTVAALSDDVLVLPTHFADIKEINENGYVGATLGAIRASNEVMRNEDREAFTEKVAGASGATPPNFEEIVGINRGEIQVTAEQATDLEIGPNRCAVHHS
ncbi:MBL fold metallo-hydrolase [Tumebacillus sp. DT12]|uniref:MBL fold metallo-hydrolase n=1 Tax=Tumebacillus lacus TaxID=2995335 RepID=A0ABT3WXH4_9BACL|nr:MBL fold metallo-hydrolase [Tumebacillus lacus]MCX7569373.1 MBL fold metallo-hydrolase [Tumebacillus lacus]